MRSGVGVAMTKSTAVYPRTQGLLQAWERVPSPIVFLQGFSVDFVKKACFSLLN